MLKAAHLGLEKMSVIAQAVKDERWDDAKREIDDLQRMLDLLSDAIDESLAKGAVSEGPSRDET